MRVALHRAWVVLAVTISNHWNTLLLLPWSLADTDYPVATKSECKGWTRECRKPQAAPSPPKTPLSELYIGRLQTQRNLVRKLAVTCVHTHYQSCLLTHSAYLTLHNLTVKTQTRKTQLIPNSMVSGLCSLMITGWENLGIPELQVQGWTGVHELRKNHLGILE